MDLVVLVKTGHLKHTLKLLKRIKYYLMEKGLAIDLIKIIKTLMQLGDLETER